MASFEIVSDYRPTGDQPQAIEKLADGLLRGLKHQTLLGVTGSGKTFTMAGVIEKVQRPALVIAHNKTLAAQLASEFQEFFPENSVQVEGNQSTVRVSRQDAMSGKAMPPWQQTFRLVYNDGAWTIQSVGQ